MAKVWFLCAPQAEQREIQGWLQEAAQAAGASVTLKLIKMAHVHTRVPRKLLSHSQVLCNAEVRYLGPWMSSLSPEVALKLVSF